MFIYSVKIAIIWLFLQIIGDDMAKAPKTAYVCNDCGAEYSKWMGQCKECLSWNTISEVRLISAKENKSKGDRFSGYAGETSGKVQALSEISFKKCQDLAVAFKS